MSIVLKENEWAFQMIQSRTLGKKPSETLYRVARYYIDNGYNKKETRRKLESFLIQCEPTASIPKWSNALEYALSRALKYKAINIDNIPITKPELDKIASLEGKQIKRLAFTLLCLAKYWKIVVPESDYWVNNPDNEIMSLANINTSIKRQGLMYWTLREAGLVQFSRKVDNTNVRVCFVEDGEVAMNISDFRNLGYQYLKYIGDSYIECQNCGMTIKINDPIKGRKQKYCKSCAIEIAMQQRVNSVMKRKNVAISKTSNKPITYTVYMHISPNGRKYIGTTSTALSHRWKNGIGYVDNQKFSTDISFYGWDNIKHFKVLETTDIAEAKSVEQTLVKEFQSDNPELGYNRSLGMVQIPLCPEVIGSLELVETDGFGNELR